MPIELDPPVAIITRARELFLAAFRAYGFDDPVVRERFGEYILARGLHWHD